jgi:L-glyceraldehyde 3-phosphate reductase
LNNFGADRTFETQRAIVMRAFDNGVTHFDPANNYGPPPGAAEAHFGRTSPAIFVPIVTS